MTGTGVSGDRLASVRVVKVFRSKSLLTCSEPDSRPARPSHSKTHVAGHSDTTRKDFSIFRLVSNLTSASRFVYAHRSRGPWRSYFWRNKTGTAIVTPSVPFAVKHKARKWKQCQMKAEPFLVLESFAAPLQRANEQVTAASATASKFLHRTSRAGSADTTALIRIPAAPHRAPAPASTTMTQATYTTVPGITGPALPLTRTTTLRKRYSRAPSWPPCSACRWVSSASLGASSWPRLSRFGVVAAPEKTKQLPTPINLVAKSKSSLRTYR